MNYKFNKISVIGLGYIGLPTAALLASKGLSVVGVDVSQKVVQALNEGKVTIVEPGLEELVSKTVGQGVFHAVLKPEPADAFLIAVPTPFKEGLKPDISYVEAAVRSIAAVLVPGNLIILESTSPVGTTEQIVKWLAQERPDLKLPMGDGGENIFVAYCPERVLPGHTLKELVENERIIGGLSEESTNKAIDLYRIFVKGTCHPTNARTAEMSKLSENAFRDVNIAFANELSIICEDLHINVWELIELANLHPRVNILQPGPGVGGHCIAVDPWFIVDSSPKHARIIRTAREVNDSKPQFVIDQVKHAASLIKNPSVACLGLSFKADIDDLRESPAVSIVKDLAELGIAKLSVVEPHIVALPKQLGDFKNIQLTTLKEALALADIVLLLVNHQDFSWITEADLKNKVLIDTRGQLR